MISGNLVSLSLSLSLYFYLRFLLRRIKPEVERKADYLKLQREKLEKDLHTLSEENRTKAEGVGNLVKLYDITKAICSSLKEEEVFNNFRGLLGKHMSFDDCRFIKTESQLPQFKGYTVFPLGSQARPDGYLLISGLDRNNSAKFEILRQQFLLGIKRASLYQAVAELAITDSLTGLFSRRYLMQRFGEEIERSRKFKFKFAVLMIDIDHFKSFNDHYGHLVGDAILKEAARLIKENIRQIDVVGRYGGEEFIVLLTEIERDQALFAAERIRQSIHEKVIKAYDEKINVAASIGLALFPEDAGEAISLIEKSDQALYSAKNAGRNRVCVYGDSQAK